MWKSFNLIKDLKSKENVGSDGIVPAWEEFVEYNPLEERNPRDFTITDLWKFKDFDYQWERILWYSENLTEEEREYLDEENDEDTRRIFQIDWWRIVQIAKMTNFDQKWWIARLYDVLEKLHIQQKLENKWEAQNWDLIKFWDHDKFLVFRG